MGVCEGALYAAYPLAEGAFMRHGGPGKGGLCGIGHPETARFAASKTVSASDAAAEKDARKRANLLNLEARCMLAAIRDAAATPRFGR